jgi:hypothetical protein
MRWNELCSEGLTSEINHHEGKSRFLRLHERHLMAMTRKLDSKSKEKTSNRPIESCEHRDKQRVNNPPGGERTDNRQLFTRHHGVPRGAH